MVPMDPILIIQVLNNLLENAVIHGGTTTAVRLSVPREGESARFSVADNGQGIPADKLARVEAVTKNALRIYERTGDSALVICRQDGSMKVMPCDEAC